MSGRKTTYEDLKKFYKEITDVLEVLSDERRFEVMTYLFEKEKDDSITIDEITDDLDIPKDEFNRFEKEILRPLSHQCLINGTYIKNEEGKSTEAYRISDLGKSLILHLYGEFLPPFNEEVIPYSERFERFQEHMSKL